MEKCDLTGVRKKLGVNTQISQKQIKFLTIKVMLSSLYFLRFFPRTIIAISRRLVGDKISKSATIH